MNIRKVNTIGFQARIKFGNNNLGNSGVSNQNFGHNSRTKSTAYIKKTLLIITCFSALISKLIKVRNGIKLPS